MSFVKYMLHGRCPPLISPAWEEGDIEIMLHAVFQLSSGFLFPHAKFSFLLGYHHAQACFNLFLLLNGAMEECS